ncbi:hypothetical protein B296_00018146 [Ensete ventricosum]|uniref:Uncharacterized protein n=1 Tax=Ensete ventricosum TaxID=4639 RepID=A0A427A4T3_ENSVE|nr:hypothetical protein B296_00018146 [Ensete ventricosum]
MANLSVPQLDMPLASTPRVLFMVGILRPSHPLPPHRATIQILGIKITPTRTRKPSPLLLLPPQSNQILPLIDNPKLIRIKNSAFSGILDETLAGAQQMRPARGVAVVGQGQAVRNPRGRLEEVRVGQKEVATVLDWCPEVGLVAARRVLVLIRRWRRQWREKRSSVVGLTGVVIGIDELVGGGRMVVVPGSSGKVRGTQGIHPLSGSASKKNKKGFLKPLRDTGGGREERRRECVSASEGEKRSEK